MRGRKPTPTAFKVINGNPGKRPLNTNEPQPTQGAPNCPDWLGREAKAEWKRIVPELDRIGALSLVDRGALTACCLAWEELYLATKDLQEHGRTMTIPVLSKGQKVGEYKRINPSVRVQQQAFVQYRAYLVEFGLTPSSRTRIKVPPKSDADPMEQFLNEAQ